MMNWINPLGLDAIWAKAFFASFYGAILAALGFGLVALSGTPLINLGTQFGFSAAAVGSFVGLALLILAYDFIKGSGFMYWADALLGGAGGTLAIVFLAQPLGAVLSFSNIVGFVIGIGVIAIGIYAGVYIGKKVR